MGKIITGNKIDNARIPDGGWGWMVVFGVAVTNMCNQAIVSVFGLLFGQHLEEMGHETEGISLVSNVSNMVMSLSGLVTGPVLQRYTCRSVTLFGTLLTFFGLIMSSFATNISELLIYYSFFTGLGLGLIYPATFVAIKAYFVDSRARAVGLSMAGTGIGQMLMPQLVRILLDEFGFRWTVRILAALCLHGIVGSLLFQPVHWHLKPVPSDTEKLLNKNNESLVNIYVVDKKKQKYNTDNEQNEQKENNNNKEQIPDTKIETEHSKQQRWYQQFHLSLFYDVTFLNLCIGLALVYTAGVSFGALFPLLLQEGPILRLTRADTALAMTLLSGADIVGRVCTPWFMWKLRVSSRSAFLWGVLFLAGARTIIALQGSLIGVFAASVFCGIIRSATVINQNLTVSEYCTNKDLDDRLPAAIGLMMVAKGLAVISLGQLLGWLRDYTQSYTLFVHGTNVLMIIVFITWGMELIILKMKRSKLENMENESSEA